MTAQIGERIYIDGQEHGLCTYPLTPYMVSLPSPQGFRAPHTALWRGYIGTWEINGDRLYLIAIEGELNSGEAVTLETLFPGFPDRVFAHWYSGRLRVPQGRMLKYVHQGFASQFEQDLFIDIERGLVQHTHIQTNGTGAPDAPVGHRVSAATMLPRKGQP